MKPAVFMAVFPGELLPVCTSETQKQCETILQEPCTDELKCYGRSQTRQITVIIEVVVVFFTRRWSLLPVSGCSHKLVTDDFRDVLWM